MATIIRNNRLIKRAVLKSYVPGFLIALVYNLNWILDIALAAFLIAPKIGTTVMGSSFYGFYSQHFEYNTIAAIGIALPIIGLITSFLLAFVEGTSKRYNDALARGYKDECKKIFSQGFWAVLIFGLIISIFNFFIVELIDNNNDLIIHYVATYLKFAGLGFTLAALNRLYTNTLGVHGHYRSIFAGSILNIACKIGFSILIFELFGKEYIRPWSYSPEHCVAPTLGVGALALGTCAAELITFLFNIGMRHHLKAGPVLGFVKPFFSSFIEQFEKGFPVVATIFVESAISCLINLIIWKANCWHTSIENNGALTVYTVVRSFWQIAQVPSQAMGLSTIPMIGLYFSAKDKEAVKDVWKNGTVANLLFTLAWVIILIGISPLVLYPIEKNIPELANAIGVGVLCVLPCAIAFSFIYMLQTFYSSIDKPLSSILISAIPTALIFPVTLVILLNVIPGDNNLFVIWLTLGLSPIVFILGAYITSVIKNKTFKIDLDRLLQINKAKCDKLPLFDVSINTLEEVSQLAETVQAFFKENEVSDRTSMFAALAVDEIAHDIMSKGNIKLKKLPENIPYLDIKIMSESDIVKIVIRDAGAIYNPLAFDQLEDNAAKFGVKAVQKMANYIQYQRVYKMNIVTIEIAK